MGRAEFGVELDRGGESVGRGLELARPGQSLGQVAPDQGFAGLGVRRGAVEALSILEPALREGQDAQPMQRSRVAGRLFQHRPIKRACRVQTALAMRLAGVREQDIDWIRHGSRLPSH